MLMLLLALVLAFVCFKLGVFAAIVSMFVLSAKAVLCVALLLAIYCLFRWWLSRSQRRCHHE